MRSQFGGVGLRQVTPLGGRGLAFSGVERGLADSGLGARPAPRLVS